MNRIYEPITISEASDTTRRYLANHLTKELRTGLWTPVKRIQFEPPKFRIVGAHAGTNKNELLDEFMEFRVWQDRDARKLGIPAHKIYLSKEKYDVALKDLERVGLWHYLHALLRERFQPYYVDLKDGQSRIRRNVHVNDYKCTAVLYLLNFCEVSVLVEEEVKELILA